MRNMKYEHEHVQIWNMEYGYDTFRDAKLDVVITGRIMESREFRWGPPSYGDPRSQETGEITAVNKECKV